jgi:mono/diheme cytochrome c family protein
MRWLLLIPAFVVANLLGASLLGAAELSADETRWLQTINESVRKAGVRYAAGDYQQAADRIAEAISQLQDAVEAGSPALYDQLEPTMRRIQKAHTMLEFEGASLPPFQRPVRPMAGASRATDAATSISAEPASKPAASKPAAPAEPDPVTKPKVPSTPEPNPSDGQMMVSFTEAVAPILVRRCGQCHIRDSKGGFSTASFSALMKGPPEGVVVFAGDTVASRLIETIETGDMPRGGGRVTPQELDTLKAWILAGAKFDGEDPDKPIAGGATPSPTVNMNLEVRRATGEETVSFAADIAPLLVDNCSGCHIDAMQTRGGLRMDSFAQLLRGGDSGPIVTPGKGSESLLVKKLRGMVGQRMPAGERPALAEESIELISTWIDEGATLDGASETQPIRVMSQLAWAASATPEQLSQRRQELADANLKLVTASSGEVNATSSDHFRVTGPVSTQTLDLVTRLAEEQIKTVRTVVKARSGEGFFHGRATIFVFPKRYDYSEFAKMVERRSIPTDWSSHWSFDGIDAYVSVVCGDQDEEEVIASRLAAPLVSLAVASRGRDVPRWFAEGTGTATATRLASTRDREARRQQEAAISAALASMENAKQFLEGKLPPEQTDRIGAAIAATMLERTQRRNFDALLRSLDEGKSFDQAFLEAFRATPEAFVGAWMRWVRGG